MKMIDPLELNPLERERIEKVRKHLEEQKKLPREQRLLDMVGVESPPGMVLSASRHLDMLDSMATGGKNETMPTLQEIEDFVITPEQWTEALQFYREHRSKYIAVAVSQVEKAVSYRNPPFKVGCVVASIGPDPDLGQKPIYKEWEGYNLKLKPGEVRNLDKKCAERNALDEAQLFSKAVFAIITASKELSTGDQTRAQIALHPCSDCRNMYRDLLKRGFLRGDTIVCSVNNSKPEMEIEEMTLRELLELYKDDEIK